jgi:alpha-beta hydrolase superfamily lysophospholipase
MAVAALLSAPVGVSAAGRPVTLPSADGVALAGMLYEAAAKPAPGVVLVHMLSRSKADWVETAEELQNAGVTALAIDLRGHGQSAGSAGDLVAMKQDVTAAITWLSARPGMRPAGVGVAGASLGANLALLAAADLPSVRAVAAVSPVLDYRGVRIDVNTLKRIGTRPVWLGASSHDPYSLRTLHALAADTSGPRDQRLSDASAHGTRLFAADHDLFRNLVDWLRQTLLS